MEPEACSKFATNVRESGFGLYSYLSSGKSSAIATSLRPTSFHCSKTAAEGLAAGFGGSFFASLCAIVGIAARNAARQTPAILFMQLPLFPFRQGKTVKATHRPMPATTKY